MGGAVRHATGLALFTYALTFVSLGIYWVNHHHLLHTVEHVSGGILWANLHLLFWLSLMPFMMFWMNEKLRRRCRPPLTASCCCVRRSRSRSSCA